MKNLNQKLFVTAVVCAFIEVALIFYFGMRVYTHLPQWGLIATGVVGGVMTMSLLLFFIRKATGADKRDNI